MTITSAAEDQFVDGLLSSSDAASGSYWMGLRRTGGPGDGTFQQWTTGEKLAFTKLGGGRAGQLAGSGKQRRHPLDPRK